MIVVLACIFGHPIRVIGCNPQTSLAYESPSDDAQVNGIRINTFVSSDFLITAHDEDGARHDVSQSGVLMQMSNGDFFFRPSKDSLPDWANIDIYRKWSLPMSHCYLMAGLNPSILPRLAFKVLSLRCRSSALRAERLFLRAKANV